MRNDQTGEHTLCDDASSGVRQETRPWSAPLGGAAWACLPALVLLLAAFGPGSFGGGRGVQVQLLGWSGWALLAWCGRQDLLDPLGLSEHKALTLNRSQPHSAGGGWWTLLGWLPTVFAVGGAARFAGSDTLRIAAGVALATLSVAGVRRLMAQAPSVMSWSLAGSVTLVAIGAAAIAWQEQTAPALPLGHHNLLVLFLLPWLPLLMLSLIELLGQARRESRACEGAGRRFVARIHLLQVALAIAMVVVIGVVVATRSLTGAFGLVLLVTLASSWLLRTLVTRPRDAGDGLRIRRRTIVVAVLSVVVVMALGALAAPRLGAILSGEDASASARQLYLRAASAAFAERPVTGWGLGRGGFGLQPHLPAEPGVRVAGMLLSDAHSLWVDLILELGWPSFGLLMIVGWAAARRVIAGPPRGRRTLGRGVRATMRRAGQSGLLLLFATSGVAGWFDVGALWFSSVLLLAMALGPAPLGISSSQASPVAWRGAVLVVVAIAGLVPDLFVRHAAAAAERAAEPAVRMVWLERAARWGSSLDRLAWGIEGLTQEQAARAPSPAATGDLLPAERALLRAARESNFWFSWTLAGDVAGRRGELEQALTAWRHACDLEPMAPFAALRVARAVDGSEADEALARALIADPRSAGADLEAGQLLRAADLLSQELRLPAGWRQTLVDAVAGQFPASESSAVQDAGPRAALQLHLDREGETSVSLFFYRRAPRPRALDMIEVDLDQAQAFSFSPAAQLKETDPSVWSQGCRLGARGATDAQPR